MPDSLHALQTAQRAFADARDRGQLHSPRNLTAALSREAAEERAKDRMTRCSDL